MSSLTSFDKDFYVFGHLFIKVAFNLTLKDIFFFPQCPSKGISCFSQKTLNSTIEQCSSYILVIILWPRVFLLGRFRSIIYTWRFEVGNPLHKFSFLPMSRKRKSLCIFFPSISRALSTSNQFWPIWGPLYPLRKPGLCDLGNNCPNFPTRTKEPRS